LEYLTAEVLELSQIMKKDEINFLYIFFAFELFKFFWFELTSLQRTKSVLNVFNIYF
jgi:hypothetical protein